MRHDLGEFPVHFFGSNDYLWTYQARVFPYMEADANGKEKMGKGVDSTYKKGTIKVLVKEFIQPIASCFSCMSKYLSIKLQTHRLKILPSIGSTNAVNIGGPTN